MAGLSPAIKTALAVHLRMIQIEASAQQNLSLTIISRATLPHGGYSSHYQRAGGWAVSHSKLFLWCLLGGQRYAPGTDPFGTLMRSLHVDIWDKQQPVTIQHSKPTVR